MGRKPDFTPVNHKSISRQPYLGRYLGRSRVMVDIKCPRCNEVRARTASETRSEALRNNFQGFCRPCSFLAVQDGDHRWNINARKEERKGVNSAGYFLVYPRDVPDKCLPMYRSMQNSGQPVLAHRWAMALLLNRALFSYECVDHRDGDKSNNDTSNLRIYLKGKQQEGSCPGYGTYYHEWKMAEARVKSLEEEIAILRDRPHSTVGAWSTKSMDAHSALTIPAPYLA